MPSGCSSTERGDNQAVQPSAGALAQRSPAESGARPPAWIAPALAVALAAMTLAVFTPAVGYDFIVVDDDLYVSANEHVLAGLTRASLAWAWTTLHAGLYQPVTWMSLQLDTQLLGTAPWCFHLSNVLWHTANVVLLFVVLRRLTGAVGRSATVAALFAVHPLHVESVAWVTERKDLVSMFFALLAIWAYAAYVERPGILRYATIVVAFALGLLAKPMVVTLPFILLLLDYWPLRRVLGRAAPAERDAWDRSAGAARLSALVLEKLPLFALAFAMAGLTLYAHNRLGGVVPLWRLSIGARLGNVVLGYAWFVEKTFWPLNLARFYPYLGDSLSWRTGIGSALLLLAVTALALWGVGRWPYLLVGWLWFLGALVPVIGLVPPGEHPVDDHFSYFPQLGLLVLIVWWVNDLLPRRFTFAALRVALASAVCLALAVCSRQLLATWRDSFTLMEHALQVAEANPGAHNALGVALARRERLSEAEEHYARAVQLDPANPKARLNLAHTLLALGKPAEAVPHYREIARVYPDVAAAQFDLGVALVKSGQPRDAIEPFANAARLDPAMTHAQYNLGVLWAEQGDAERAMAQFHTVLALDPEYEPTPHVQLGKLLTTLGRLDEAVAELQAAQRLRPGSPTVAYQLGQALARGERWAEAEAAFRQAVDAQPRVVHGHCALAHALARQGQLQAARAEYRTASRLDPSWPRAAAEQAWTLATDPNARRRDGRFAVQLAEQACEAAEEAEPHLLDVLASAYAEVGQYEHARTTAARALALAQDENSRRAIAQRLELYRALRPYRTAGPPPR
jgi:protein O-mannosyl-transferase